MILRKKVHFNESKSGEGHEALTKQEESEEEILERSLLGRILGRCFLFIATVEFLFIGSFLVSIQLVLKCIIECFSSPGSKRRRWLKELNCYLMYVTSAPALTVIYRWARGRVDLFFSNRQTLESLRQNHNNRRHEQQQQQQLTMVVMNHSYELDYMNSFIMMDQLGQLPMFKLMAKNEIKYLPIIGWSVAMCDVVFVRRDWARDKRSIGSQLDKLLDYGQAIFLIYAEGTRFTREKFEASRQFAQSRQLKPFKHHLLPKSRGFTFALAHFIKQTRARNIEFKLINLQCLMPHQCDFRHFLAGRQLRAEMFCEEIELAPEVIEEALSLNHHNDDDEDDHHHQLESPKIKQLLMDIYRRKDEIVELYARDRTRLKLQQFPLHVPFEKTSLDLLLFTAGTLLTSGALGWLVYLIPWTPTSFWLTASSSTLATILMYNRIQAESTVKIN